MDPGSLTLEPRTSFKEKENLDFVYVWMYNVCPKPGNGFQSMVATTHGAMFSTRLKKQRTVNPTFQAFSDRNTLIQIDSQQTPKKRMILR